MYVFTLQAATPMYFRLKKHITYAKIMVCNENLIGKENNIMHSLTNKLNGFFQEKPCGKVILLFLVWVFPLYAALIGNFISFGSLSLLGNLLTEQIGAFFFGLILFYLLYLALALLFSRFWVSALITGFLGILLPLIDYFKVLILKEHFYPWDLALAQNAGSFTEFLSSISFPISTVLLIVIAIVYVLFLFLTKAQFPHIGKKRFIGGILCALVFALLVFQPTLRHQYETLFGITAEENESQNQLYHTYGFFTAFIHNIGSSDTLQPSDYSKETMQNMFAEYVPENPDVPADFQYPDVVVILSEAFWDPTALKGVTFSDDPLKNYRAIAKEHPSGQMVSCTFGGGTIRPEFEVLTGMSTSALPPGNMPYQQYVYQPTFSYPQLFKSMGYDTLGIHTYQKTFYERNRSYPLIGIDQMLGENDLNAELHWNSGPYITDQTIAEEIIYQLEQPHDTGLFLMAITMENHSMYHDKFDESDWDIKVSGDNLSEAEKITLQNYCKGTKDSDAALGQLYEYIMQREKPTVLLWYGDHLPTLGENFVPYTSTGTIGSDVAAQWTEEEKNIMFRTPYLMFANYDTHKEYFADEQAVSPYMLGALLCDYINAPECLQTNFLLDAYNASPYMSQYYDLYAPGSDTEEIERILKLHRYLTYDELIGEKYLYDMQGFTLPTPQS